MKLRTVVTKGEFRRVGIISRVKSGWAHLVSYVFRSRRVTKNYRLHYNAHRCVRLCIYFGACDKLIRTRGTLSTHPYHFHCVAGGWKRSGGRLQRERERERERSKGDLSVERLSCRIQYSYETPGMINRFRDRYMKIRRKASVNFNILFFFSFQGTLFFKTFDCERFSTFLKFKRFPNFLRLQI